MIIAKSFLSSRVLENTQKCVSFNGFSIRQKAFSSSSPPSNQSKRKEIKEEEPWGPGPTCRMRIVMKSANRDFGSINIGPYKSRVGLPTKRKVYTVLRSPHVHKKSREQFEMRISKQIVDIETTPMRMAKKFYWFKRQKLLGAQHAFIFNYKTRLQLPRPQSRSNAVEEPEVCNDRGVLTG
eukprot:TRINITY_DN55_c0_g2_i2.p1 TRINITY_DN55_c0_g2~~TRINITY_DN55_c0_g2_i2.p1  ORF type:complete len:181 (-),score=5.58 TRINITY_DN55_c0_g2_i2:66-608(-)